MKYFITLFFRLLVGGVFIFSGFVKLIDPLGSAYKFQEYFSPDVLNLDFLSPYALQFSIFLIIAEILLGVMLIVGSFPKLTTWSLLVLIIVFLYLTWYSAFFNKVTDCGCFGDAIKLTSWETFYKNIVLVVLIIWLVFDVDNIFPIYSKRFAGFLAIVSFIGFVYITYYVLIICL